MKFFILAGGHGKRARPLTLIKPKPLFPLNGKVLLTMILNQLKKYELKKGFINLYDFSNEIKNKSQKSCLDIKFFQEKTPSGSKILTKSLDFSFKYLFIINGDMFLEIPFEKMTEKITESNADVLLLLRQNRDLRYSSINISDNSQIEVKKTSNSKSLMYTGVAILKRCVVEKITESSIFSTLQNNDFKIQHLIHKSIWLDVGEPHLYYKANFEFKKFKNNLSSNSLSNNVHISADSSVKNSIIWENTSILDNSEIINSIVTGNMILKDSHYQNKIITSSHIYDL